MEGYQVLPVAEAARVGEVSVTVTGNRTQALAVERLATAADPSRRACTRSRPRSRCGRPGASWPPSGCAATTSPPAQEGYLRGWRLGT